MRSIQFGTLENLKAVGRLKGKLARPAKRPVDQQDRDYEEIDKLLEENMKAQEKVKFQILLNQGILEPDMLGVQENANKI